MNKNNKKEIISALTKSINYICISLPPQSMTVSSSCFNTNESLKSSKAKSPTVHIPALLSLCSIYEQICFTGSNLFVSRLNENLPCALVYYFLTQSFCSSFKFWLPLCTIILFTNYVAGI